MFIWIYMSQYSVFEFFDKRNKGFLLSAFLIKILLWGWINFHFSQILPFSWLFSIANILRASSWSSLLDGNGKGECCNKALNSFSICMAASWKLSILQQNRNAWEKSKIRQVQAQTQLDIEGRTAQTMTPYPFRDIYNFPNTCVR